MISDLFFSYTKKIYIFDFDGVLSDIVDDPSKSFLTQETINLLFLLRKKYKVYIVTGRSLNSILSIVEETFIKNNLDISLYGQHGIEYSDYPYKDKYLVDHSINIDMEPIELILTEQLISIKDYRFIENKGYAISCHFKNTYAVERFIQSKRKILLSIFQDYNVYFNVCRSVLEIIANGVDKKLALNHILSRAKPLEALLYAGDDINDLPILNSLKDLSDIHCEAVYISDKIQSHFLKYKNAYNYPNYSYYDLNKDFIESIFLKES